MVLKHEYAQMKSVEPNYSQKTRKILLFKKKHF